MQSIITDILLFVFYIDIITNGRYDAKEFSECSDSERIVDVISGEVIDFLVREYNVKP